MCTSELCTFVLTLHTNCTPSSSVHSVHSSLKVTVCSEHTDHTLCALLKNVHTSAKCAHLSQVLVIVIFKCPHSSYIWQGNAEQCVSFVPGRLKIIADVDHRAVALPDLAAVTLHFDPEQQHHGTVPSGIQVDPKVALSACRKRKGRGGGGTKRDNPSWIMSFLFRA